MTQNYEHADGNGSPNPNAANWAEVDRENGPVHLDLSTLDFSKVKDTYSKIKDPNKAIEVEISETTQKVETVITEEDGTERVETVNIANPGDAIVTGEKGERYIINAKDFHNLYEPLTEENGVAANGKYLPKNVVKCMENPEGKEIVIDAPWGGQQTGGANCIIVESQIENSNGEKERYIIERGAFEATYKKDSQTAEEEQL